MIETEHVNAIADQMQYAMVPPVGRSGLAVGVDAVHLPTFQHELDAGGARMLEKLFTAAELDFCAGRVERLGVRMAAKEAALKALGTGMRGIRCPEVEVFSLASGQPRLHLHGAAKRRAARLGLHRFRLSLCHEGERAGHRGCGRLPCVTTPQSSLMTTSKSGSAWASDFEMLVSTWAFLKERWLRR